jgi:hypothetical protein
MIINFGNNGPPTLTVILVVISISTGLILVGATQLGFLLLGLFALVSALELLFSKWQNKSR